MDALLNGIKTEIVNPAIYLLLAMAAAYFVWGVFMFVSNYEDPEAQEAGKKHMIWGVIGIAIMLSAFGIMRMIAGTIGVANPV